MYAKTVRPRVLTAALVTASLAAASGTVWAYSAESWQGAGQVYQKICGHCHETGIGPVIKGRELPPDYIKLVVRHGNRAMPAFRPADLNDQTLDALARLISTSQSSQTLADQ